MSIPTIISHTACCGFPSLVLTNKEASITVIPSLGGRLISFTNQRTNREWMWHPPGPLQLFANRYGDAFPAGTHAGLDECIPTIKPCIWKDCQFPDHGEIWTLPWDLDDKEWNRGRIKTRVILQRMNLGLTRTISLAGSTLTFDYELTNLSSQAESYLWSMHPFFTWMSGDRLDLPRAVRQLKIDAAHSAPNIRKGSLWTWPTAFPGFRLNHLQLGQNQDADMKAFTHALPRGWARLSNQKSRDFLEITWDTALNPYLGIWISRGGYQGWHHVGIEPTNGPGDNLTELMVDHAPTLTLAPGENRNWSVQWRIGVLPG